MSLFVINRYEGEEFKKDTDDTQDHLSQLLKRIEERKRQRETETKTVEKDSKHVNAEAFTKETDKPKTEISKKKKKKRGVKRKLEEQSNEQTADVLDKESVEKNEEKNEENVEKNEEKVESKNDQPKPLPEGFTILGSKKRLKKQIVKRFLPHWLTHPEIVSPDLSSGSVLDEMDYELDSKLVEKLKADGFNKLFPVQDRVLSWLLKCDKDYKAGRWVRDTCVSMPTGSGKTLAYVLPIIQLLQNSFVRLVRCLIVLPVQELATQVYEVVAKYSSGTSLKVTLISGASSFKEEQDRLVQKNEKGDHISGVDIVIATPGRLIDHIRKTSGFSLSALRFLVIDEADRSTDWLQYIPSPHLKAPPLTIGNIHSSWITPAQKLLFSATLSQDPEKLSRLGLFRPILFTSAVVDLEKLGKDLNLDEDLNSFTSRYGNPSELTEKITECTLQHKPLALYQLLVKDKVVEKTLIFTNSCESAHRLAILLNSLLKSKNVNVGELSAKLGSKQREETLEKFIQGTLEILVSSDALARGLDIPGIKLVVSYDLPKSVKGYIHRAGRTGRGGMLGTAISLLLPNQIALFGRMLNKVGRSIPEIEKVNLDNLAESVNYQSHLENLQELLSTEQEEYLRKLKSHKRNTKT